MRMARLPFYGVFTPYEKFLLGSVVFPSCLPPVSIFFICHYMCTYVKVRERAITIKGDELLTNVRLGALRSNLVLETTSQ